MADARGQFQANQNPGITKGGFRFAMPAGQSTLPGMCAAESKPASVPKKEAILLIDDEKTLLEVFAAALSPHFEVATATSTREAEFILHKQAFKVVIADHLMPGGNGMSFLVRAREDFPHMQRILVTGYMKPEMLMRSVNEAALFRYLLKPVELEELIQVVQDAAKAYDLSVASA
jgi:DNA-binding NtrC family response regulator